MILKASQRAGGMQLAMHLLKTQDNEHVEVHEIRGFVSDDLIGAFKEAQAVSQGTRCRQFLFSLSLSPPETAKVSVEVFEQALADIEAKMKLTGQPRAIVFHEKEGRRHAHCVWSRIDVDQMKAINLPHFKLKLRDISRQLYLEHGWQMPRGLMNSKERNPLNFSQAEWQQAKRAKQDPRAIKETFKECWAASDSASSFTQALQERGYYLCKGDRRGHVAIDWRGETYALSRWLDLKEKDVRARLGDARALPSVEETKDKISALMTDKLKSFIQDTEDQHQKRQQLLGARRIQMVEKHRAVRDQLRQSQATRKIEETSERAQKLPHGIKALWFRVTGKYGKIVRENEIDTKRCEARDQLERQKLVETQLRERRSLQHEIVQLRHQGDIVRKTLNRDLVKLSTAIDADQEKLDQKQRDKSKQRPRSL